MFRVRGEHRNLLKMFVSFWVGVQVPRPFRYPLDSGMGLTCKLYWGPSVILMLVPFLLGRLEGLGTS